MKLIIGTSKTIIFFSGIPLTTQITTSHEYREFKGYIGSHAIARISNGDCGSYEVHAVSMLSYQTVTWKKHLYFTFFMSKHGPHYASAEVRNSIWNHLNGRQRKIQKKKKKSKEKHGIDRNTRINPFIFNHTNSRVQGEAWNRLWYM